MKLFLAIWAIVLAVFAGIWFIGHHWGADYALMVVVFGFISLMVSWIVWLLVDDSLW